MVYWEKQSGGLCRKHSINAYFGKEKYNVNQFNELCNNYDIFMNNKGYKNIKTKNFDAIESNQFTVISYSLFLDNTYSVLIPFNNLNNFLKYHNNKTLEQYINSGDSVFVFNEGHIWLCKKDNNRWICIDSLNGIRKININQYNKNIGFIVPRNPKLTIEDLHFNINKIKKILLNKDINQYLLELFNSNQLIGDLEILLSNIINILKIIIDLESNNTISNIITIYDTFLLEFEKKRINFDNINTNIPIIINELFKLDLNAFKIH